MTSKSNTGAKTNVQKLLSMDGVNAAAIARGCDDLKDMSDDGRRSFISKIKRGKLHPNTTLSAQIRKEINKLGNKSK